MHGSAIVATAHQTFHSLRFERPEERSFMTQRIRNHDIFCRNFAIDLFRCRPKQSSRLAALHNPRLAANPRIRMDCIETYIEKYAVRNAGSLVRETTSFESVAKRIATPTIRTNVHIICLVICFLRLVVKRHRFLFSAQGHTRKASRDPFKCAT
jgi:hypothetical protein